jgi:hypothetical protein
VVLHDLSVDPQERHDIAAMHPQIVRGLRAAIPRLGDQLADLPRRQSWRAEGGPHSTVAGVNENKDNNT